MVNALYPTSLKAVIDMLTKVSPQKFKTVPSVAMIVGFPNVGKSSIINGIRKASSKGKLRCYCGLF